MDNTLEEFETAYEKIIDIQNNHGIKKSKKSTLILGTTGVGKTTLAKFLFTNNKTLQSINVFDGADEYMIQDEEKEISCGIESETSVPKTYYDGDLIYYDCPGFSDNRSSLTDIMGATFIKHIIENNTSIRLMIAVNYSSIQIGIDKLSFLVLIKHIIELVKNIEIFKNSIVLIITKVNKYNNEISSSNDDDMLYKELTYFLENIHTYLNNRITNSSNQEKIMFKQQLKFIEILKKNHNIIFFKRPMECGPLNNIKLLQKYKMNAKQILTKILFTNINKTDLGFTISDNSKIYILNLIQKIEDNIISEIDSIRDDIMAYYLNQIKKTNNIKKSITLLDNYYQKLSILISNMDNSLTYSDLIFHFMNYLNNLSLENKKHISLNVLFKNKCIKFLEGIYDNKFKIKPLNWTEKLKNILLKLEKLQFGFNFLIDLYNKLQIYDIYKLFKNIDADLLNDKLVLIIEKITNYSMASDIIMNNDCLKKHFDSIISTISDNNIKIDNETLIARGNYICLSKINSFLNEHPHNEIKEINVYALNVFFIDEDFSKEQLLKMIIISPKWIVVDNRKINLKGNRGEEYNEKKAQIGKDGKPGLPGKSGCSFMGITKLVLNASNLHIDISGGDGAAGQDGGDGFPGKSADIEIPDNDSNFENGINKIKKYPLRKFLDRSKGSWHALLFNKKQHNSAYIVEKVNGESGGDGFMAGKGGNGGFSGECHLLIDVEQNGKITIKKENGKKGVNGRPGNGGKGGKNGDSYMLAYTEQNLYLFSFILTSTIDNEWSVVSVKDNGTAESGKRNYNLNEIGMIQESKRNYIENPWSYIIDYKKYLLNNISETNIDELIIFFIYLSENVTFEIICLNVEHFYNEYNNLEKYSLKNENENTNILYKIFANSIINFIKNKKTYDTSSEILLRLIYVTILRKLSCLDNKKPKNFFLVDKYYSKHALYQTKLLNNAIKNLKINVYDYNFCFYFIKNMKKQNDHLEQFYNKNIIKTVEINQLFSEKNSEILKNILTIIIQYSSETVMLLIKFSEFLTDYINDTNMANTKLSLIKEKETGIIDTLKNIYVYFFPKDNFEILNKIYCDSKDYFIKISKNLNNHKYIKNISINEIEFIDVEAIPLISKLKTYIGNKNDQNNLVEFIPFILNKINKILIKIKTNLNDSCFYSDIDDCFLNNINILHYEIDILINIYDQFEYLYEQKIFNDHLAYVNNMIKTNVVQNMSSMRNYQFYNSILNNIILDQYNNLLHHVRDISFPFGMHLIPLINIDSKIEFSSLDEQITCKIKEIEKIISNNNKMEFFNFENYIIKHSFHDVENENVFYTWNNNRHKNIIKDLLLGKEISIKSNILNSKYEYNVIKFNAIGISLHSTNTDVNTKLKKLLENCTVTIKHMGNSYYKLNNKYYIIVMNMEEFEHNFTEKRYAKLKGLPILSPYATFNIKLRKINNSFILFHTSNINEIYDKIDMHLIGEGQYIHSNTCENLLKETEVNCMYNQDNTYNE